jgi:heme exporter protein D
MNWSNWAEFWHMGGRGLYVWGSFGVAAVAVAVELWLLRARRHAALGAVRQQILLNEPEHDT